MAAGPSAQHLWVSRCSAPDGERPAGREGEAGACLALWPQDQSQRSCTLSPSPRACDRDTHRQLTEQLSLRLWRHKAVLVAALVKMKKPKWTSENSYDSSHILNTVFETVSLENSSVTYAVNSIYRYLRSISCEIRDTDQKCFKLEAPTHLVALHLQGPNIQQKVRLSMALYRPKSGTSNSVSMSFPVALGIKGRNLYLSCAPHNKPPILQLEEADLPKDVQDSELERFIFYKVEKEDSVQFESAACPGWYICTFPENNQPVSITNRLGEELITNYLLLQGKR